MTVVLRKRPPYRGVMPAKPHHLRRRGMAAWVIVATSVAVGSIALGSSVAAAAPAMSAAAPVMPAIAPGVATLSDPIADEATRALAQLRLDVALGGELSPDYIAARASVAALVGARLWTPSEQFVDAWSRADLDHQLALMGALSQLGVPYKRNASQPGVGFDCSGLTTFAWSMAGFQLPRNSTAQIRAAEPRTFDTAQAGDLVRYPGHVMMWLGVSQAIVHSPFPGRHVEIKFMASRAVKRSKVGDPTE
jgi:cell wall-associated NlpC family hydrolase